MAKRAPGRRGATSFLPSKFCFTLNFGHFDSERAFLMIFILNMAFINTCIFVKRAPETCLRRLMDGGP